MGYFLSVFWKRSERRIRSAWRLILQALAFVVATGLLGIVVALVVIANLGQDPTAQAGEAASALAAAIDRSWWYGAAVGIGTLLAAALSVAVAGWLLDRRRFRDFGFRFGRGWWLDFGFGLSLGAGLMLLIFVVELAAGWVSVRGTLSTSRPDVGFVGQMVGGLILFICVGCYEEMLSRGYQLRNLAEGLNWRWWSPKVALALGWVLSSAFFGALHATNPNASPVSTANLMLAGLFLGLGFVLTGELAIPIGIHITWNFFQGNVFGFPVSGAATQATFIAIEQRGPSLVTGGAFGPEAGLIGICALLIGGAATVVWVRRRSGSASLQGWLAEYRLPSLAPAADGLPDQPRAGESSSE